MASPIVTLFNPRGGSGKTFLTYHLFWMFAEMGVRVLAVDLDPDADLTAALLEEGRIVDLWNEKAGLSVKVPGVGDFSPLRIEEIGEGMGLVLGHPSLWLWEEEFGRAWDHAAPPPAVLLQLLRAAADAHSADIVLLDLASNLGALNHAALHATDFLVLPVLADVLSVQALRYVPPLEGRMEPSGYVALQGGLRLALQAGEPTPLSVLRRIYREVFLGKADQEPPSAEDPDPDCLGVLPDFPGLRTLAQEARKPIFHLKPADGAGGSHLKAAQQAHDLFRQLALRIAQRLGVEVQI